MRKKRETIMKNCLTSIGKRCLWAVMAMGLSAPGIAWAQGEPVDADRLFRAMADLLTGSKAFSFHMEKSFDVVLDNGAKVKYAGAADVAVRRPDGLYITYGDDLSAKEVWYDGMSFTLFDQDHQTYGTLEAPPRLDDTLAELSRTYDVHLPLAGLLSSDPYTRYQTGVREKLYLGLHDVEGVPSHHFLFRGDRRDWQIWIDAGEQALPRKVVVTYRGREASPQQSIVLSDWDLAVEYEEGFFAAELPEEAVKIEFMALRELEE